MAPDGTFLTGTFADYPPPTDGDEVPDIEIRHLETPSTVTPLGAKGLGEGNCMSTPVCLANAVADALGADDVTLPLTPSTRAGPDGDRGAASGPKRARGVGIG